MVVDDVDCNDNVVVIGSVVLIVLVSDLVNGKVDVGTAEWVVDSDKVGGKVIESVIWAVGDILSEAVGGFDTVFDSDVVDVCGAVGVGGNEGVFVWGTVGVGGRVGVNVDGSDRVDGSDILTVAG